MRRIAARRCGARNEWYRCGCGAPAHQQARHEHVMTRHLARSIGTVWAWRKSLNMTSLSRGLAGVAFTSGFGMSSSLE